MKPNPGSLPLIFLMFVMLIAVSTVTVTAVPGDTVHNLNKGTDYATITAAVAAADIGDTIQVDSGSYMENNIEITKSITLVGNGPTKPVINGQTYNGIIVSASDVQIIGINITNSYYGITISNPGARIRDVNVSSCDRGISVSSSYNQIFGVNATNCNSGIYFNYGSDENEIRDCNVTGCSSVGIYLYYARYNNLQNNNLTSNNIGLLFEYADYNTIVGNNVSGNTYRGIRFRNGGSYNEFYQNIFINNYRDVDYNSNNLWNSESVLSYQYHGTTFTNKTGNYWANYEGADSNNDGIGDSPKVVYYGDGFNIYDNYPMILVLPVPPKTSFTLNATGDYAPLGVKFTDTSTRNPTSWHWEFGDGATSDEQNPVHFYTTPGTYLVNLTATNEYGSNMARMASTGKCIVALQPLPSSLSFKWASTYPAGTGSSVLGYDVVQASDDGFALVGYQSGADTMLRLIKADSGGNSEWDQVYSTTALGSGNGLVAEADGGFTFAGENNTGQIIVTRTAADGSVVWATGLANTNGNSPGIAHTADGGYLVTGGRSFNRDFRTWGRTDYMWVQNVYLARLNADGTLAWERTFGHFTTDLGWQMYHSPSKGCDVVQADDGGYVIAGYLDPIGMAGDLYVVKTDSNGNFLWNTTYGVNGIDDGGKSIVKTADGGYLVTGYTWTEDEEGDPVQNMLLVKVSAGGLIEWDRAYSGYVYRSKGDSLMAAGNGCVIAGQTITPDSVTRPYLVGVDENGEQLWGTVLNFSIPDHLAITTAADGFVIGGSTGEAGSGIYDAFMMKIGVSITPLPVIGFASDSATADEGTTARITLHRSGDTSGESRVLISNAGGTAIAGKNYTFVPVWITFPAGEADAGFDVALPANAVNEPADTYVNFSLSNPINAVLGSQKKYNLSIHDTTPSPSIQFAAASGFADEGTTAHITLTRTGAVNNPCSVNVIVTGGTADSSDYTMTSATVSFGSGIATQTIDIDLTADHLTEGDETLILGLTSYTGATAGTPASYTLTIADTSRTLPAIGFTAAAAIANEGTTAHITLTRSGDTSLESSVLVSDIAGTAVRGTNYTFVPVRITFEAGQAISGFDVGLPANTVIESVDTYVNFSLSDPINAVLGGQIKCNLTIHDTTPLPVIQFAAATGSGNEGTTAQVTLTRTGASNIPCTVNVIVSGGTADSSDYTIASATVTFGSGVTSQTMDVDLAADHLTEGSETLILGLSALSGATAGTPADYTLTIADTSRTLPSVAFTTAAAIANEGTTAHIMLHRTGDTSGESSVLVTDVAGTAIRGTNYTFVPVRITFVADQADSGFDVGLPVNSGLEPVDTFINFSLSDPINSILGSQVKFNLTIHMHQRAPDAIYVGIDRNPVEMFMNEYTPVQITMRNTGDLTWDNTYVLTVANSQGGIDAYPVDGNVAPGSEYTFNIALTTHGSPGTLTETVRMMNNDGYFGGQGTFTVNMHQRAPDAIYVGIDRNPVEMFMNEYTPVQITMRNTGDLTWDNTYVLTVANSQGGIDAYPVDGNVAPGSEYTFNIALTTHGSPGTLTETVRMMNNDGYFGGQGTFTVNMHQRAPDAIYVGIDRNPVEMFMNEYTPVQITMRNTGDLTWDNTYVLTVANSQGGIDAYPVDGNVAPGSEYTFNIALTTHGSPGTLTETVRMMNNDGYFGGQGTFTVNLKARPQVQFAATTGSANEGTTAHIMLHRTGDTSTECSVLVTDVSGTAVRDKNYTFLPVRITFEIGSADAGFDVGLLANSVVEPIDTYVNFSISDPINAVLGSQKKYNLSIHDTSPVPDATAPITTCTLAGTAGLGGWNTSNVAVDLSATDAGGSSVASVSYKLDSSAWVNTSGSHVTFTIATNGIHTLLYYATDVVGNQEAPKTITVKINKAFYPVSLLPADGATGISLDAQVRVTFNAPIGTIPVTIKLEDQAHNRVAGDVSASGNVLTFTPHDPLAELTTYTATVTSTNPSVPVAYSWDFTTLQDTIPPVTTISITGVKGANDWYTSNVTVNLNAFDADSGVANITYRIVSSVTTPGNHLTLPFYDGSWTVYYYSTDFRGNKGAEKNFTIKINKKHPSVSLTYPQNDATGIAVSIPYIAFYLDTLDDVDPSTIGFTLADAFGNTVPGTFTYESRLDYGQQINVVTFRPSSALAPGTIYTATMEATDFAGNALLNPTIRFRTAGIAEIDDAEIMSIEKPDYLLTINHAYSFNVTVLNKGTTTWSSHSETGYFGNYTWGYYLDLNSTGRTIDSIMDVSMTPSTDVVRPGDTVTYRYIIIPRSQDVYYLKFGMAEQWEAPNAFGISRKSYFGKGGSLAFRAFPEGYTPPVFDDAAILSADYPIMIKSGQKFTISLRVENVGTSTWTYQHGNFYKGTYVNGVYQGHVPITADIYEINTTVMAIDASGAIRSISNPGIVTYRSSDVVLPGDTVYYTVSLTLNAGVVDSYRIENSMLGLDKDHPTDIALFGDVKKRDIKADVPLPKVGSIYPGSGATGVLRSAIVQVNFWQPMDSATAYTGFVVKDSQGNKVNGTIDYNSEYDFRGTWINSYATFTPVAPGLENGATYTVYLNGMTDLYGQVMSDYSWSFTTKTIPVVVSASPANGATGVLPGASITVRFSQDMDPTSVRGGFKIKDGANQYIGGNVIVAGNTSTFVPSAPLANGKSYTVSLNGLTDLQNNLMADYTFKFTVVPAAVPSSDPGPTGTPTPQPTTSFQTTVNGVGVTVNGNQITAQQGVDLTMFLPNGLGIVPTSHGLLTMDVMVSPLKNIGMITGVHIGDQSSNTLNGGLATVTATADLDSLPSGSVSFTATVSDPTPADISAAREWLGRRSRTLSSPLAMIDVQKSGFTNDDIVNGTAKITLTMKKPTGFSRTKTYTVIRHGDTGYEELTATFKSETTDTVTFEILSPNGFSTFLVAETAAATPTPAAIMTPPPSATPVPSPSFLLSMLAIIAGVMIIVRVRKN